MRRLPARLAPATLVRAWRGVFHGFGRDLKVAGRRLFATPAFTIFAAVSIALGVGVTTTVHSVVDRICWPSLGIPEPDGLVLVTRPGAGNSDRSVMSVPDFEDLRAAQTCFSGLAASSLTSAAVTSAETTAFEPGEAVDGSYFPLLGIHASIGRVIQHADYVQAAPVVVLSHRLWKSRFASNPDIVGQTVRLSGRAFEVVGVVPDSFAGVRGGGARSVRLWVPLSVSDWFAQGNEASTTPARERRPLTVVGRLRPGAGLQRAATELAGLSARLDAAYPQTERADPSRQIGRGWGARPVGAKSRGDESLRRFGMLLLGVVSLVLVVACTNLANLVLARGTTRRHELAVRLALGASRWRLVREQCAESLLLAMGGAALAAVVIQALGRVLPVDVPVGPGLLASFQPQTNAMALVVAGCAALLSFAVFGLEPALQLTRTKDVRGSLEGGAGGVSAPRARRQRALLRWQVAITTGFFIVASICMRIMIVEAGRDSGVDVDRLGVATVGFPAQQWAESRARQMVDRLLEKAQREPGIEAVAASTGMPFGTFSRRVDVSTTDKPLTQDDDRESALVVAATAQYFQAAGISILRGRHFDDRDDAGAPPVVVLSESTARKICGTVDAVGRQLLVRIRSQATDAPVKTATVVGVAENTDTRRLFLRDDDTVYVPFAQGYEPSVMLLARASEPATALAALQAVVRNADPGLAVVSVATGWTALSGPYLLLQGLGFAAVALGGVALLLSMVGLYGVQSHLVARRTRELGVRISVGATSGQITRMVLEDGYRPVLQGLGIGLLMGLAGRVIFQSLVVGNVDVVDPWTLAVVPIPVVAAAFWACYLPARRASRVDPNEALRHS